MIVSAQKTKLKNLPQPNHLDTHSYFRLDVREDELMSRCSVCNSKGFVEVGAFVGPTCVYRETTPAFTSALPH